MSTNTLSSRTESFARPSRDAELAQSRPTIEPDRFAVVLGGAALAVCGITRGTLPGLVAAALGGYAAYCAAGVCHAPLCDRNSTFGGPQAPRPATEDSVDEASLDSFPASDPPSFSASRG